MPIKFNFNICDNSSECSGKATCPTGAIYWDENAINALGKKGLLSVDNAKCTSCGQCTGDEGCPVGAIILAQTEKELDDLTKGMELDQDKVKALFVDRYGAEPIDEKICIAPDDLKGYVGTGVTIIEEFAEWSIQCLLNSIPVDSIIKKVRELTGTESVCFYKCDCSETKTEEDNLPSLKVFKDGKLIASVAGYYENSKLEELVSLLKK